MRRAGPVLLACAAIAAGLAACGGDDDDDNAANAPTQPTTTQTPSADGSPSGEETTSEKPDGEPSEEEEEEEEEEAPQLTADERAVARIVRDYVGALDDRNSEAACAVLVPGAIDEVEMPKDRGSCAASLEASIGFRDPRGLPVWKTARVADVPSVEVESDSAKVVVTTVTEFADRDEPSIEDDVVYLERSGDEWLIAKPSSTLYRAVGIADVPPSVLAPP
jgi:hypothetical protein